MGLKDYTQTIHEKFETYHVELSVEQVSQEMQYVIREYKNNGLIRYIRIFFRAVFLEKGRQNQYGKKYICYTSIDASI